VGVKGGGTKSNARPQQRKQKANPKVQATTLESKGVAEPSLGPGTLGEEGFDLLELRLEHSLDMLPLLVDLTGHLGLERCNLRISPLCRSVYRSFNLLLMSSQALDLLLKGSETSFGC